MRARRQDQQITPFTFSIARMKGVGMAVPTLFLLLLLVMAFMDSRNAQAEFGSQQRTAHSAGDRSSAVPVLELLQESIEPSNRPTVSINVRANDGQPASSVSVDLFAIEGDLLSPANRTSRHVTRASNSEGSNIVFDMSTELEVFNRAELRPEKKVEYWIVGEASTSTGESQQVFASFEMERNSDAVMKADLSHGAAYVSKTLEIQTAPDGEYTGLCTGGVFVGVEILSTELYVTSQEVAQLDVLGDNVSAFARIENGTGFKASKMFEIQGGGIATFGFTSELVNSAATQNSTYPVSWGKYSIRMDFQWRHERVHVFCQTIPFTVFDYETYVEIPVRFMGSPQPVMIQNYAGSPTSYGGNWQYFPSVQQGVYGCSRYLQTFTTGQPPPAESPKFIIKKGQNYTATAYNLKFGTRILSVPIQVQIADRGTISSEETVTFVYNLPVPQTAQEPHQYWVYNGGSSGNCSEWANPPRALLTHEKIMICYGEQGNTDCGIPTPLPPPPTWTIPTPIPTTTPTPVPNPTSTPTPPPGGPLPVPALVGSLAPNGTQHQVWIDNYQNIYPAGYVVRYIVNPPSWQHPDCGSALWPMGSPQNGILTVQCGDRIRARSFNSSCTTSDTGEYYAIAGCPTPTPTPVPPATRPTVPGTTGQMSCVEGCTGPIVSLDTKDYTNQNGSFVLLWDDPVTYNQYNWNDPQWQVAYEVTENDTLIYRRLVAPGAPLGTGSTAPADCNLNPGTPINATPQRCLRFTPGGSNNATDPGPRGQRAPGWYVYKARACWNDSWNGSQFTACSTWSPDWWLPAPHDAMTRVNVLGPDLVIDNITFRHPNSGPGSLMHVDVTVRNAGETTVTNRFDLAVWAHQPAAQGCVSNYNGINFIYVEDDLAPGASVVKTLYNIPAPNQAGSFTLRAYTDSGCAIPELNEGNNQYTLGYTVVAATPTPTPTRTPTATPTAVACVPPAAPGTVTGTRWVQAGLYEEIRVQWGASANAYQYRIQDSTDGGSTWNHTAVVDAPQLYAWHSPVLVNSSYLYRVRATTTDVNCSSGWTTAASAVAPGKPDLVVTAITLSPAAPPVGSTFSAQVTVRNQGPAGGVGTIVAAWRNRSTVVTGCPVPTPAGTAAVAALGPNQSQTVTITGLLAESTAGQKTFQAFADKDCILPEANESNNHLLLTYTTVATATPTPTATPVGTATPTPVVRPDFVVTAITLSPASPPAGSTFSAQVTVRNQGTASGDAGVVAAWRNRSTVVTGCPVPTTAGTATVGTLAAGASRTVTISGIVAESTSGSKTFQAFADKDCLTAESNETNNHRLLTYTVP